MANESEAASIIWYSEETKRQWVDAMLAFKASKYECKFQLVSIEILLFAATNNML